MLRPAPILLCLALAACDSQPPPADPAAALSAGQATVWRDDVNAYSQPSANLQPSRRLDFSVGNSFFRNPWVAAPASTTARDGLGPLFNSNVCQNCHIKDGRGRPPHAEAKHAVGMLVRLSIPDNGTNPDLRARHGSLPDPVYGSQLQDMALPGARPEARVRVLYDTHTVAFADGHEIELQRPRLQISALGHGPLATGVRLSARVAPPMIGLGLLEAIPEAAILANADPEDANGDGISGRANRVWDIAGQRSVIGRFGWKAGQPSLDQQNSNAFAIDMGLTNGLFPADDCTPSQGCAVFPSGAGADAQPEVSDGIRAAVLFYTRNLAVPARRDLDDPKVRAGEQLFHQAGCAGCHTPAFTTAAAAAEPELENQLIRPYSDLLLHDMGDGLADQHEEFLASGREWRTPPLWGIGLSETVSGHSHFLHDGRARNLLEAVLWHGGEADAAKLRVLDYDARQREALLAFLNSL